MPSLKTPAKFIEPMDCLPVSKLPEGPQWVYEIKLDGYRAVAVKAGGKVTLFSRNHKPFTKRFPLIVEGLADLPDETVIDGEIVALDVAGRPDFNLLQNFRDAASRIVYYVFDVLVYQNRDLTHLPLNERRELMFSALKLRSNRVFASEFFEVSAQIMLQSAREQGLEGIVGKRRDSLYEPGTRSKYWVKYRLNLGQEFVIGGFTPGPQAWIRLSSDTTGVMIWSMLPERGTDSFRRRGEGSLRTYSR
jgi:ATP-dependent DNA ligase